jgi:HK97 family phage portal protein
MSFISKLIPSWFRSEGHSYFNVFSNDNSKSFKFRRITDDESVNGFLGNDSLYSIVHKIALNGGTLPYKVYKGETEVFTNDKYFDLLESPNSIQSRFEFMYQALVNMTLTGDLYIVKNQESIGFGVDSLIILPSQTTSCERVNQNDIFSPIKRYTSDLGGVKKYYEPEEIIHLKYFDPSVEGQKDNQGLSPLQAGQYILEANNNLTVAEASILNNRGANNIIASGDGEYTLTSGAKAELDEGLRNRIGGAKNFNKTITTASKIEVHKLDMSPSDLGLIETFPNQLRRLCTLFSMPAELFNADRSGQFNTRKEALKSSYTEGILPVVELIYSSIDRGLRNDYPTYCQKVDRSKIEALNLSKQDQIDTWLAMFEKGAISREKFLELSEIEDTGNEFVKQTGLQNGQGQANQGG